jgi:hypothetical protein
MFEGLIEFIEQTVFALVNRITSEEKSGVRQLEAVIGVLLAFAQKNRGMTRVLIGDALVNEDSQLQVRINQLHDRLEAVLKQALRFGVTQKEIAADVDVHGARERPHVLRHRPLAPVRKERIQARPRRAVGEAMAPADGRRNSLEMRDQ